MRENRTYGSEGGEAKSLPYPYRVSAMLPFPVSQRSLRAGWLRLARNDNDRDSI